MEVGCAVFPGCHLGQGERAGSRDFGRGGVWRKGEKLSRALSQEWSGSVERSPEGQSDKRPADRRKGEAQLQLERTESPQEEEVGEGAQLQLTIREFAGLRRGRHNGDQRGHS